MKEQKLGYITEKTNSFNYAGYNYRNKQQRHRNENEYI